MMYISICPLLYHMCVGEGTHSAGVLLKCVAVCCTVLQCVAVCCSVLCHMCVIKGTHFAGGSQYLAVCCSMLQCVAECCSVLYQMCVIEGTCMQMCRGIRLNLVCRARVCVAMHDAVGE